MRVGRLSEHVRHLRILQEGCPHDDLAEHCRVLFKLPDAAQEPRGVVMDLSPVRGEAVGWIDLEKPLLTEPTEASVEGMVPIVCPDCAFNRLRVLQEDLAARILRQAPVADNARLQILCRSKVIVPFLAVEPDVQPLKPRPEALI